MEKLEETLIFFISQSEFKILRTKFSDEWIYLSQNLAYPNEFFKNIKNYQKLVNNCKKEDLFGKLNTACSGVEEIDRTKEIFNLCNFQKWEELTKLFLKSDTFLLTCVFEKYIKVSNNGLGIKSLNCVSLPGFTWLWGLKNIGIFLETLQHKEISLLLEYNFQRGIRSFFADRHVNSDEY